jgi:hypothetical protein
MFTVFQNMQMHFHFDLHSKKCFKFGKQEFRRTELGSRLSAAAVEGGEEQ